MIVVPLKRHAETPVGVIEVLNRGAVSSSKCNG
jgi:hypothetical protein